jgi:hypothetical protein
MTRIIPAQLLWNNQTYQKYETTARAAEVKSDNQKFRKTAISYLCTHFVPEPPQKMSY